MSALAQERSYTVHDIFALPDGERAELIDGQIYYMAPPARKHQRIVGEMFAVICEYINSSHGICEVNIAPFAVFLNEDEINYVEPDICVVCDHDKLTDKGCSGARTGSSKSYHLAAVLWIITQNFLNTEAQVFGNIGL